MTHGVGPQSMVDSRMSHPDWFFDHAGAFLLHHMREAKSEKPATLHARSDHRPAIVLAGCGEFSAAHESETVVMFNEKQTVLMRCQSCIVQLQV